MQEMSSVTSLNFDPIAASSARRLPVESAMPGTTLRIIPLRAFGSGSALYGALFPSTASACRHRLASFGCKAVFCRQGWLWEHLNTLCKALAAGAMNMLAEDGTQEGRMSSHNLKKACACVQTRQECISTIAWPTCCRPWRSRPCTPGASCAPTSPPDPQSLPHP